MQTPIAETHREKNLMIDRRIFFSGLVTILSTFEHDIFTYAIDVEDLSHNLSISDGSTISIYLGNQKLVSHSVGREHVMESAELNYMMRSGQSTLVPFSELKRSISPILEVYPYLKEFLEEVKSVLIRKGDKISTIDILMIVREYTKKEFASDSYSIKAE